MHIVRMLIVGLIVGILARFFYPGAVHMGLWLSAGLGILGSLLAGLVGQMLSSGSTRQPFHPAGFFYSILGAIVVIFIARHFFHLV